MQRDDHIPLHRICSTPGALHESVEKIIDLALYEVPNDEPIRLRFITPVSPDEWLADDNYNDYRLTTPEEHEHGMIYITVSYCWQHTQSSDGLSSIPRYCISGSSKELHNESRPVRCPELVFHRAMIFAKSRQCQFVWIDQECIDQTDAADIQAHLKVMHRVYEESTWTFAPLSNTITNTSSVDSLMIYLHHDQFKHGRATLVTPKEDYLIRRRQRLKDEYFATFGDCIRNAAMILYTIREDNWFTRSWTFQEKRCANALFLAIPVQSKGETLCRKEIVDLYLDVKQIQSRLSTKHRFDMQAAGVDWMIVNRINFDYATTSEKHMIVGLFGFCITFELLQACQNLVVADRVAIFGHVCRLQYRLVSTMLNSVKYSFTVCIIALILGNAHEERTKRFELIMKMWNEVAVCGGDITVFMSHLCEHLILSGEPSNLTRMP
jgi:hypothetical protein